MDHSKGRTRVPQGSRWTGVCFRSARRQCVVVAVLIIVLNVLLQYLSSRMRIPHPLVRALLETAAFCLLLLPVAYLFHLRPLARSLAAWRRDAAEREAAQEALRETDELFTLFMQHSPVYTYIKEVTPTESRVLRASENFQEMIGIPGSRMNGRTMRELFPAEFAGKMAADDWTVVSEDRVLRLEEEFNGRSYTTIKFPIVQGGRRLLVGYTLDQTEWKQAEEARRRSEQLVDSLLDAIPAGVFWKNRDLVFLGCNRAFAVDAGYDEAKDVVGRDDFQMSWRDQAQAYRADDREVIESGASKLLIEEPHTLATGETRTVLTSKVPLRDARGEVTGVLGTYMDITARRRAEEAVRKNEEKLAASERKYRQLIESAPQAIYVVENGRIVFANGNAVEMLGYAREELVGMPMERINHPEDWGPARERYLQRAAGRSLPKSITRHLAKSGEAVWVECVGERIEWEGKPAVLYFSFDLTELKNAEKERLKYDEYLQRTQRLESLGVLAGGIAHDFNNILAVVFGYVDLARQEERDATVREYLALAMDSMDRAKALTQQLLTFAKGGTPVRRKLSLVPLVRETCQFSLHGSNVTCTFDVPADLWPCDVDRNQIAQVIQNLVLNAAQSMPMGGTLEVEAANETREADQQPSLPAGRYVRLSVRDHGIGIPEEMLPRIFDPFFTTKSQGHGLGLSISHSIISRHGGAISVQSRLGSGTVFHVHLPACAEAQPEATQPLLSRHQGKGTILVMDDEEAVRTLLSRMLRSIGYTPICRSTGLDALAAFQEAARNQHPFAAVILDLTIPGGMGGREVAEKIRSLDRTVPMVVSSGYASDPVLAHPGEYGFTASLPKPFTQVDLMETLQKHLPASAP